MSDVVTGEAVALDLRIAQMPSRLTAAVIDLAVMALAMLIVVLLLVTAGLDGIDDALFAGIYIVVVLLIFLGYPLAMETLTRGRTLGKLALGLRVVRDDGGPITFRHALVRSVVGLTLERPGIFLPAIGPPLGLIVSMFSRTGKRIGDMAAGTVVLQERTARQPDWTPVMPPPLAWWAPTLDLAGLDDELALFVRQFLGRSVEMSAQAREVLAADLVADVRAWTTPAPPPGTPGWAYLTAVLAERRRREEDRMSRAAGGQGLPPGWYPGWPPPAPPRVVSPAAGPAGWPPPAPRGW